jgi:hypothetical protein
MNTHADKTQENKSQSVSNETSQKKADVESTFQFVDKRPEAVAQLKLQEMANNSPQAKQLVQLQAMANQYQNSKVTQLMLPALGRGLVRNAPRIATGIGLAGSIADMHGNSKGLDISKFREPEQFKKFSNIGREAMVSGLSLTPFGKISSAVSFANNMFDMQDKLQEKNPNQAIKSLALAEIDKIGATGFNLGMFGSVVTALGGADKLLSNKDTIADGFASVAEFMQAPASPESAGPDDISA